MSWAALWWLTTRTDALVILLAPTADRQGRGIIVREVEVWAKRAGIVLRSDAVGWHLDSTTSRLVVLSGSADIGAIEGQHAPSVLLVADEAKSLTRASLDAVAGALTGEEARVVLASTPGAPSGPFYDACTQLGDAWARHHVPANDSSNVSVRWVTGRQRAWGATSPTYMMRVCGEFPQDGAGTLFPWALLHAARAPIDRVAPSQLEMRGTTMGVDVARSLAGDMSSVCVVRDGQIVKRERWHGADSMRTTEKVISLVVQYRPDVIRVDAAGPGGGVVDRLRDLGYPVQEVHFGGRSREPQRFENWRAEAYHTLRDRLEAGTLRLLDDDRLSEELAAVRITFSRSSRIMLGSKDDIRALIGRSPDDADALALACSGEPREGEWRQPTVDSVNVGLFSFFNHGSLTAVENSAIAHGLRPCGDPILAEWPPPEDIE